MTHRSIVTTLVVALAGAAAVSMSPGVRAALTSVEPAGAATCCSTTPDVFIRSAASLTLEGANRVLAAAVEAAKSRSAGGAIAVVDDGGALIAFQRLDGTFPAGASVSIGKARTASIFRKPTRAFEESINGGRTALAAVNEMVPLQGGVPIVIDGDVVGAIGVSGAHSQVEDEDIAKAGAAAVENASTQAGK